MSAALACAPVTNTATAGDAAASAESAATAGDAASAEETAAGEDVLQLTLEELSQYDGQNGNPAYIAVDGVIYDVSDVSFWSGGRHNGFSAGADLTDAIKNVSPHGVSKLSGLPVVGELID
jgi:predicted heme/steroid binding protein